MFTLTNQAPSLPNTPAASMHGNDPTVTLAVAIELTALISSEPSAGPNMGIKPSLSILALEYVGCSTHENPTYPSVPSC